MNLPHYESDSEDNEEVFDIENKKRSKKRSQKWVQFSEFFNKNDAIVALQSDGVWSYHCKNFDRRLDNGKAFIFISFYFFFKSVYTDHLNCYTDQNGNFLLTIYEFFTGQNVIKYLPFNIFTDQKRYKILAVLLIKYWPKSNKILPRKN